MELLFAALRCGLGVGLLLGLCWLLSENRRRINWRLALSGVALQLVLAALILKVPFVHERVEDVSRFFSTLIGFAESGARMLFGSMPGDAGAFGIAFLVLPTIIFFASLSAVLYHLRVLQAIVYGLAWLLTRTLKLSGAEALAAAANVFVGQTEAPLVVQRYLAKMTRSEVNCLMTGGMATIAGGVLAIYMYVLGGDDEAARILFGKHFLTASLLSAPAAVVAAKMLVPQTEVVDGGLHLDRSVPTASLLDAATQGATDGLRLALNVGAMLIAFTGLLALLNYCVSGLLGGWTGLDLWVQGMTDGRLQAFDFSFILGLLSAPFAWIMGVPSSDVLMVGQLLGERLALNEFVAYLKFAEMKDSGALSDPRTIVIATYALCGFANFTSIGIQVGGIAALEPSLRPKLLSFGLKSMIGGMVACYLTATIAALFV